MICNVLRIMATTTTHWVLVVFSSPLRHFNVMSEVPVARAIGAQRGRDEYGQEWFEKKMRELSCI